MTFLGQFPYFRFKNEDNKNEKATDHVEPTNDSEKDFKMKVTQLQVFVVSMEFNVDAFRKPRESHDQKKFCE